MKKLSLLILFLGAFYSAHSQIYKGVKPLEPYYQELKKLDINVSSNINNYYKDKAELMQTAIKTDNKHLQCIIQIYDGSAHYYKNQLDSAKFYFEKAKQLSESISSDQLNISASIRRIFCDENEKSAMELTRLMHFEFARAYNNQDTINMIYSMNGLAMFYQRMDSTEKALRSFYQALYLSERSNNKPQEGFILNNLALLKIDLGAKDSAYADLMKGLRISQEVNDLRSECHIRENLGLYYSSIDSFDLAEKEYNYVLAIGNEHGFVDMQIVSILNLSGLERSKGNLNKSDSLYKIGLYRAKEGRMFEHLSIIYVGRASLYNSMGRNEDALKDLDSSLVYAEFYSTTEVRKMYHRFKSKLYEEMGKDDLALQHYKEYKHIDDSLRDIGNDKLLDEFQFRYADEKKERIRLQEQKRYELQLKQKEIDMAKFRQNVFFAIGGLGFILLTLLVFYFRLKQKSDSLFSFTIVNKLEEERAKIARDLHDGLGQSMILLKNRFNNLKVEDEKGAETINENFSEVIEEIRGISRSLIPPELKRLGLVKAINNMMNEIENSTSFVVTTEIDDLDKLELEPHQNIRLYRIIQELTTNTIKHSKATSIKLEVHAIGDGEAEIIYQDNGRGLDLDKWRSASNSVGFRSIEQRLKYLRGSIKIEKPKQGFKVVINIKQS